MKLRLIKQVKNLTNKKVLYRVDYNLPLVQKGKLWVAPKDHLRLISTLPTIKYLLSKGCSVTLMSWLGRPEGERVEKYSLRPVAMALAEALNKEVSFVDDCAGEKVEKTVASLQPGEILVLENVRFRPEEENDDKKFAKELVKGFDLVVFDAFAQSHRDCPSITGIMKQLPSYAGFLLEKEITQLQKIAKKPQKPFTLILGGAKLSDKINVMTSLMKRADYILIGGGLANIFLKAIGIDIAKSYVEEAVKINKNKNVDFLQEATKILKSGKIVLPIDMIAADDINKPHKTKIVDLSSDKGILPNWYFGDIGPDTIKQYQSIIKKSKMILWNGPMGVYESPKFANGTRQIAIAITRAKAVSVLGGGDTEIIIKQYNLQDKFTHVSTGGGAMLKFLEGKMLPGIKPLVVK